MWKVRTFSRKSGAIAPSRRYESEFSHHTDSSAPATVRHFIGQEPEEGMSKFDRRLKRPVNRCGITGKRLFKSPKAAMQFVANLGADCNAPMMREYHCPLCGGSHLTSRDYECPVFDCPIRIERPASHLRRVHIGTTPQKPEILPEITNLHAFE